MQWCGLRCLVVTRPLRKRERSSRTQTLPPGEKEPLPLLLAVSLPEFCTILQRKSWYTPEPYPSDGPVVGEATDLGAEALIFGVFYWCCKAFSWECFRMLLVLWVVFKGLGSLLGFGT